MALAALALAVLAGCGSAPTRSPGAIAVPPVTPRAGPAPSGERDGPEASPPAGLQHVPDAEPRVETIRRGGPNKPYTVMGRRYVPIAEDAPYSERGLASWYGRKFHGRRTANGETYDMYAMTAAHPTLPLPSYARVRNPANGREVVVRVNDRGPFHRGRIIDLSYTAALKLGVLRGVAPVEVTRLTADEIRTGAWRRGGAPEPAAVERDAAEVAAAARPGPSVTADASDAGPDAQGVRVAAPAVLSTAGDLRGGVTPVADAPRGFWVQLGAFRQRDGADGFQRRVADELDWLAPRLGVFGEPAGFRLQAGPYASRDEAHEVAARVREALRLVPVVVDRR